MLYTLIDNSICTEEQTESLIRFCEDNNIPYRLGDMLTEFIIDNEIEFQFDLREDEIGKLSPNQKELLNELVFDIVYNDDTIFDNLVDSINDAIDKEIETVQECLRITVNV